MPRVQEQHDTLKQEGVGGFQLIAKAAVNGTYVELLYTAHDSESSSNRKCNDVEAKRPRTNRMSSIIWSNTHTRARARVSKNLEVAVPYIPPYRYARSRSVPFSAHLCESKSCEHIVYLLRYNSVCGAYRMLNARGSPSTALLAL